MVGMKQIKVFAMKVDENIELEQTQTKALLPDDDQGVVGHHGKGNGVLVTSTSQLVGMFFVEENTMMVTVDTDYMLKKWDIKTGKGIATVIIQRAQHYRNGSVDLNDGGIGMGS